MGMQRVNIWSFEEYLRGIGVRPGDSELVSTEDNGEAESRGIPEGKGDPQQLVEEEAIPEQELPD